MAWIWNLKAWIIIKDTIIVSITKTFNGCQLKGRGKGALLPLIVFVSFNYFFTDA